MATHSRFIELRHKTSPLATEIAIFILKNTEVWKLLKKAFISLYKKRILVGINLSLQTRLLLLSLALFQYVLLFLKTSFMLPSLCWAIYEGCLWIEIRLMRKKYHLQHLNQGRDITSCQIFFKYGQGKRPSGEEKVMQHGFSPNHSPICVTELYCELIQSQQCSLILRLGNNQNEVSWLTSSSSDWGKMSENEWVRKADKKTALLCLSWDSIAPWWIEKWFEKLGYYPWGTHTHSQTQHSIW